MPRLVDSETLELVDVPDEQMPDFLSSGRYGFEPGSTVSVVGRDGGRYDVPAEKAWGALDEGFVLESDAEKRQREMEEKYGGQEMRTFLEGAARGLTFGGFDQLAVKGFDVPAEDIAGRREVNPASAITGELVGAVTPIIATGGAGIAGTALRGAGAGVRGVAAIGAATEAAATRALANVAARGLAARIGTKVIAKGAGSAIEGMFYGAGQLVTEEALGHTEFTAQNLAAHAGLGALVGGGTGALFGIGGEAISIGTRKALSVGQEILEKRGGLVGLRDARAVKSLGAKPGKLEKFLASREAGKAEAELGEELLKPRPEFNGEAIIPQIGGVKKTLERIKKVKSDAGARKGAALDRLDEFSPGIDPRRIRNHIEEKMRPRLYDADGALKPGAAKNLKKLQKYLDEWDEREGVMTLKAADGVKQDAQTEFFGSWNPLKKKRSFDGWMKGAAAEVLKDEVDNAAIQAGRLAGVENVADDFLASNKLFSLMKEAEALGESGLGRIKGNRTISPSDYITGAAGAIVTGHIGTGALIGGAVSVGHKIVRERGNAWTAHILASMERAAAQTEVKIEASLAKFIRRAAQAKRVVQRSYRAGESISSSAALAEAAAPTPKPRRVAAPAAVTILKRAFYGDEKTRDDGDRRMAFKARAKELAELSANPQRLQDRIAGSLEGVADAAPKIAASLTQLAARATQFLHERAPKAPMHMGTIVPIDESYTPANGEIAKWERYVAAVEDPVSVLEDLAEGQISSEGVEVLRELYPEIHQQAIKYLQGNYDAIKDLPYQDRIQLSILFGQPFDFTMTPEFVTTMQSQYSHGEPVDESGQPVVNPTVGGMSKINAAERATTPTEKLLAR